MISLKLQHRPHTPIEVVDEVVGITSPTEIKEAHIVKFQLGMKDVKELHQTHHDLSDARNTLFPLMELGEIKSIRPVVDTYDVTASENSHHANTSRDATTCDVTRAVQDWQVAFTETLQIDDEYDASNLSYDNQPCTREEDMKVTKLINLHAEEV